MRVQERDLELLKWINGFGFSGVREVSERWGVGYETGRARLAKLVKAGLLIGERSLLTGKYVFRVTTEGVQLSGDDLGPLKAVRWTSAEHELVVQRLAMKLERICPSHTQPPNARTLHEKQKDAATAINDRHVCFGRYRSWFEPERRLRRRKGLSGVGVAGHVPDGLLWRSEGKPVAVEVERSVKPKARLKSIFEGYRRSFDYSAVWWFAKNESLGGRLKEAAAGDRLFSVEIYDGQ